MGSENLNGFAVSPYSPKIKGVLAYSSFWSWICCSGYPSEPNKIGFIIYGYPYEPKSNGLTISGSPSDPNFKSFLTKSF